MTEPGAGQRRRGRRGGLAAHRAALLAAPGAALLVALTAGAFAAVAGACSGGAPPGEPGPTVPAARDVEAVLYLIGDAGAPDAAGEPVLIALQDEILARADSARHTILYLGDNIYPRGMPDSTSPARAEAERRALVQLRVAAGSSADVLMIPGNHDWEKSGSDGWQTVLRQEAFVEAVGGGRVAFLPDRGCPGPAVRDVGRLRIVLLDTEWWLRDKGKPEHPTSYCAADTEAEFVAALDSVLGAVGGRPVIVAGHHPLLTSGPHGGHFTFMNHVFPLRELESWLWIPLPIIGSLYPIARRTGITHQDMSGSRNRALRAALDSVFRRHRPLVYASGHEHALQVLDGGWGAGVLVVSGAGNYGHVSSLGRRSETLFQAEASGYVRLEVQRDGRVRLAVVVVDAAARRTEPFAMYIEEAR